MLRPRVLLVAACVLVAGCAGLAPSDGGEPIEAGPGGEARLADDGLAETGYALVGSGRPTLNLTVHASVSGDVELNVDQPVSARLDVARYRRNASGGPAVVAVVTGPAVDVGPEGISLVRNPVESADEAAVAGLVQGEYLDLSGLSASGSRTVTMLGNETTLRTYAGTATRAGESVEVTVALASVRADGDFVTVVAVYPAEADEADRVARLAEAVGYE